MLTFHVSYLHCFMCFIPWRIILFSSQFKGSLLIVLKKLKLHEKDSSKSHNWKSNGLLLLDLLFSQLLPCWFEGLTVRTRISVDHHEYILIWVEDVILVVCTWEEFQLLINTIIVFKVDLLISVYSIVV